MQSLSTVNGFTYIDFAGQSILENFFSWLFSRKIEGGTQLSLVQAWRFGARYSIASYQNDVMRCLVDILHSNPVDPGAVREAYWTMTCTPPQKIQSEELLKMLRQAFVVQVAYQASKRSEHKLEKDTYARSILHTVAEFQEDLTYAVCIGFYDEDPDMPGVQLDKHLV